MNFIYHITRPDNVNRQKEYFPVAIGADGFIHCATKAQLLKSISKFHSHFTNIAILEINPQKLDSNLVWEKNHAAGDIYPHLYGLINQAAVEKIFLLQREENATFQLPEELS